MKNKNTLKTRKCSPWVAAGMGVAVCLSGGGTARATTGTFLLSNATSVFTGGYDLVKIFGSNAQLLLKRFTFATYNDVYISGVSATNFPRAHAPNAGNAFMYTHNAGFTLGSSIASSLWRVVALFPRGATDKYVGIRIGTGGTIKYGWALVSTPSPASSVTLKRWGFDPTGGSIKTLSDSVTAKSLSLADGRTKLHWTNKNEDGVSRYELQKKDEKDNWQAVDSETPGEGRYSVTVTESAEYRLFIEKVDGQTEVIDF